MLLVMLLLMMMIIVLRDGTMHLGGFRGFRSHCGKLFLVHHGVALRELTRGAVARACAVREGTVNARHVLVEVHEWWCARGQHDCGLRRWWWWKQR